MRTIKYLLGGLLIGLFIGACSSKEVNSVDDDTEQSFIVTNSSSSTFRIVDGQAGVVGNGLVGLAINGDGIHKGGSQSFAVDSDDCDEDWSVVVYYNDPSRTDCEATKFVPCGGSANFIFNNTTCWD